jgi:putative flavoprotein involved in K+ transport
MRTLGVKEEACVFGGHRLRSGRLDATVATRLSWRSEGAMMVKKIDTVIVGGGQAGLAMSYHLKRLGREHVVLERARIGERWRTERWDSLMFQFPNWSIQLPGHAYETDDPDGFAPKDELVRFLEGYAKAIDAPVQCGVQAVALRQEQASDRLLVDTNVGDYDAANVVVATGPFQQPLTPPMSTTVPTSVFQVHSRDYRNPQQLPPGAVLVVGSAASGAQIAEELYQAGRKVYLSVGRYNKVPRRYRGRDVYWWFESLGIWHRPLDLQPEYKGIRFVVTGVGGGHDIDLRRFAADGITLVGRLRGLTDSRLLFADDLGQSLAHADAWCVALKARMDDYAERNGLEMPEDRASKESPIEQSATSRSILELDLKAHGIESVVWCTGFRTDFAWIKIPVFNEAGEPLQRRGVTDCPGLYFLGLRRTYALSSALLAGVGPDAAFLAEHIAAR